ncbi:TonB family protein [Acidobacteriota bacterium]
MDKRTQRKEAELAAQEKKANRFGRISKILLIIGLAAPILFWLYRTWKIQGEIMRSGVEHPWTEAFRESTVSLFFAFGICIIVFLIPAAILGTLAARLREQVKEARRELSGREILRLEEIYSFESSSHLKPAILAALILHLLLIWVVFPEWGKTEEIVEQEKRYVLQKWRPQPPKRREFKKKKETRQKQDKLMPIPDPTPDEPEPIREIIEEETFDDVPISDDFFVDEPDEPPGPMLVGGDVKKPTTVKRVKPEYTEIAKALRIEGLVILRAVIAKNGDVQSVEVLKGLGYGLDEKAVEALKKWEFNPGTLNGRPVDVIFTLTIHFKLTTS